MIRNHCLCTAACVNQTLPPIHSPNDGPVWSALLQRAAPAAHRSPQAAPPPPSGSAPPRACRPPLAAPAPPAAPTLPSCSAPHPPRQWGHCSMCHWQPHQRRHCCHCRPQPCSPQPPQLPPPPAGQPAPPLLPPPHRPRPPAAAGAAAPAPGLRSAALRPGDPEPEKHRPSGSAPLQTSGRRPEPRRCRRARRSSWASPAGTGTALGCSRGVQLARHRRRQWRLSRRHAWYCHLHCSTAGPRCTAAPPGGAAPAQTRRHRGAGTSRRGSHLPCSPAEWGMSTRTSLQSLLQGKGGRRQKAEGWRRQGEEGRRSDGS